MKFHITRRDVYPYEFDGTAHTSDITLDYSSDYGNGVDTSGGDVTITMADVSTYASGALPRSWLIKKMTEDSNRVIIKLAEPSDSMFGAGFDTMSLLAQGEGVEVIFNANDKYTYTNASGVDPSSLLHPDVSTQTPVLSGTTLTMHGTVEDLGSMTSVEAYFRYRDVTAGETTWTETTKVTKSAVGAYSDTATVTAGHVFEVQAVIDDAYDSHYGAVLRNSANYYSNTTEANNDGMVRYWPLQESAGTDTAGDEVITASAAEDITFAGGVTIGSDTINTFTIYKRIFGSSDWGQATFAPPWGGNQNGTSHTFFIQAQINGSSGDHTLVNFGRNNLSIGGDGTGLQLEINNSIYTWTSALPFAGVKNLFVTVDMSSWRTDLWDVTTTDRTSRAGAWRVPDDNASYSRFARGSSGDANHQDFEYLNDGTIRSAGVWKRVLSEAEMIAIVQVLDTDGGLVVA